MEEFNPSLHTFQTPFERFATSCAEQARADYEEKSTCSSYMNTVLAQGAHLLDLIASIVILPFGLIATLFGAIHALFSENSPLLNFSLNLIGSKTNRIYVNLVGLFSPNFASGMRNKNVIALGLYITTGFVAAFFIGMFIDYLDRTANMAILHWSRVSP